MRPVAVTKRVKICDTEVTHCKVPRRLFCTPHMLCVRTFWFLTLNIRYTPSLQGNEVQLYHLEGYCRSLTRVVDDDVVEVDHHIGGKPDEDDWREGEADLAGAHALEDKQQEQNCAADPHNGTCSQCSHDWTSDFVKSSKKLSDCRC